MAERLGGALTWTVVPGSTPLWWLLHDKCLSTTMPDVHDCQAFKMQQPTQQYAAEVESPTTCLQHCSARCCGTKRSAAFCCSQESSSAAAMTDKQQAVRLRLGAHLGLALGYLPVPVPTTQAQLNIRSEEDIQADPDPDTPQLDSSDDLFLQVRSVSSPRGLLAS